MFAITWARPDGSILEGSHAVVRALCSTAPMVPFAILAAVTMGSTPAVHLQLGPHLQSAPGHPTQVHTQHAVSLQPAGHLHWGPHVQFSGRREETKT